MEETQASKDHSIAASTDSFRTIADGYRADVRRVREHNRQRRLRWLLYLNLIVLAYLVKRVIDDRPLEFGLPSL